MAFLSTYFSVRSFAPDEQGGVYRAGHRPLRRLAVALEPSARLYERLRTAPPDALWLHRPWKLDLRQLPPDVPVLYHHLPFDETLTLGHNTPLADVLRLTEVAELGYKQAEGLPPRAIGMLGDAPRQSLQTWQAQLTRHFGGLDSLTGDPDCPVDRIAVVGAMNEALVREAAERGAELYITGQWRQPARKAVEQTGMAVAAIGHLRSEEWGLRTLADVLHRAFPNLKIELD